MFYLPFTFTTVLLYVLTLFVYFLALLNIKWFLFQSYHLNFFYQSIIFLIHQSFKTWVLSFLNYDDHSLFTIYFTIYNTWNAHVINIHLPSIPQHVPFILSCLYIHGWLLTGRHLLLLSLRRINLPTSHDTNTRRNI